MMGMRQVVWLLGMLACFGRERTSCAALSWKLVQDLYTSAETVLIVLLADAECESM
jgi:hypothetical protein